MTSRCYKCGKEQLISLTLEGKSYCIDCLKKHLKDEDFIKELLKKKYPDRDWDNVNLNIK